MLLVFGPSSRAWLVIIGHLFLLANILQLAQCFPVDFNQNDSFVSVQRRQTGEVTTTTPGKYTEIRLQPSCAGKEDFFKDVFDNMAKITSDAKSSVATIEKAMAKDRKKMLPTEKSYMDLYQKLYGIFDPKDKNKVKNAKAKLKVISNFVGKYAQGLSGNQFKLDVYCDPKDWVTDGKKDAAGDYTFTLPNDPLSVPTDGNDLDICKEPDGSEKTLAFVTTSKDNSKDYMTVCPLAWTSWAGDTLVTKKGEGLKNLLGKTIDNTLNKTPESLFLHELTHAEAYFGENALGKPNRLPVFSFLSRKLKRLLTPMLQRADDRQLGKEGEHDPPAYEWVDITKLAEEDKDKTKISDIRPLDNAGLYLSEKANWGDGICRDPKTVK
ncbi:unnamed protein product [Penicillium egyptiacum]|uniref:Lysine-specific metallo-endopeptidase domain-containing protein n=1 Tax=Penicillium egyptiacum TaxID=1303716 RepID=A0A9W4PA41_9EURO|nr:unnamed protein product [Penicillium egyptiacum]